MNATDRLRRWVGIAATLGPGIDPTAHRPTRARWLLPVLMLGGMTFAAPAQWQFRSEVNPDGTLTVYKGASWPSGALVIPDAIDGRKVASIGHYAFSDCHRLTRVTVPDSVTSIGDYAFSGCTGLTGVNIPKGVLWLSHTFSNCPQLRSV